MFKNLFSSNKLSAQTLLECREVIEQALIEYRSDAFLQGVMAVVQHIEVQDKKGSLVVNLTLPFPCKTEFDGLAENLSNVLAMPVSFVLAFSVTAVRHHRLPGVKNIIAISSGKGGVGKSTTSVNLAHALVAEGACVGILDADIYGPSIPTMLGVTDQKPVSTDGKMMQPIFAQGLELMSIGFLVPDEDAAVWRGPMASKAFDQLLNETAWGSKQALDYLIIDMPPGTGDIQLTLSQQIPVAASVIVTTPQNVALADAIKGLAMFEKVKVPVLGVIENMSYHICEHCGHHGHIFGEGGGTFIAEQYQTQLLGTLPLNGDIRADADCGLSPVIKNSAGEIAQQYRKIARNVAAQLYLQLDMRSPQTAEFLVEP